MDPDKAENKEGKKVVQAEEAIKGGVPNREAAPDSVRNRLTDHRHRRY